MSSSGIAGIPSSCCIVAAQLLLGRACMSDSKQADMASSNMELGTVHASARTGHLSKNSPTIFEKPWMVCIPGPLSIAWSFSQLILSLVTVQSKHTTGRGRASCSLEGLGPRCRALRRSAWSADDRRKALWGPGVFHFNFSSVSTGALRPSLQALTRKF